MILVAYILIMFGFMDLWGDFVSTPWYLYVLLGIQCFILHFVLDANALLRTLYEVERDRAKQNLSDAYLQELDDRRIANSD